jgi:DNA-binding response OmpR family regulator
MTSQLRQLIEDFLGSLSEGLFLLQTVKSLEIKVWCLEVEKFDTVLLNFSVSDSLGGSEDLAVLKARWPTVPIVVPRDIKDENTALPVLGWGAQDCLVKRRFHRELLVRQSITRSNASQSKNNCGNKPSDSGCWAKRSNIFDRQ